jgi:expansin (peptidoglycan-binding protein)
MLAFAFATLAALAVAAPICPQEVEETAAPAVLAAEAPAAENTTASATTGTGSGDATYYAVGLGACGWTNTDSENVVAINAPQWEAGKHCGQWVTITGAAGTAKAKVVDLCPGCASGDLDMSPVLFEATIGSKDIGRAKMEWSFTGEVDSNAAPNAHALAGLQ